MGSLVSYKQTASRIWSFNMEVGQQLRRDGLGSTALGTTLTSEIRLMSVQVSEEAKCSVRAKCCDVFLSPSLSFCCENLMLGETCPALRFAGAAGQFSGVPIVQLSVISVVVEATCEG